MNGEASPQPWPDEVGACLRRLVGEIDAPTRRVLTLHSGSMLVAGVWDACVAVEVEADFRQGLYVLVGLVDADGLPERGPYHDRDGRLVRMHAGGIGSPLSEGLRREVRSVVGAWPQRDLLAGDWVALARVVADVYAELRDRVPVLES